MFRYSLTNDVSDEIRELAEVAIVAFALDAGFPQPKLHFVRQEPTGEFTFNTRVLGFEQGGQIFLDIEQDQCELLRTLLHELRHCRLKLAGGPYEKRTRAGDEAYCRIDEWVQWERIRQNTSGSSVGDLVAALAQIGIAAAIRCRDWDRVVHFTKILEGGRRL